MKFGVILCKKCHRAFGINLQFKSITCPFCDKKSKIIPEQVKYKCNSEHELKEIITKINQELQTRNVRVDEKNYPDFGKIILGDELGNGFNESEKEVYEQLDPYTRIAMKFKKPKDTLESLIKLVTELYRELGEFSYEDFEKLLTECKLDETRSDEYLSKLKTLNIIYEPREGRYKLIDE